MAILGRLKRNIFNIRGWRTDRRIIIIESDDWGTIRMSSKNAYHRLLGKGYAVDKCAYNRNDCLESNKDLEELFDSLLSFKDHKGNHPKITANTIVGNPIFRKIKESDFREYHFETVVETLKSYPEHDRVMELYMQGINSNIFLPQFHGREHLNFRSWLRALQSGNQVALDAFEMNMFSVHKEGASTCKGEFLDTYGLDSYDNLELVNRDISEGLQVFQNTFGFSSKTFIAPCYIWPEEIEATLVKYGIKGMQGMGVQKIPQPKNPKDYIHRRHFTGEYGPLGQRYLVRNAFFEPSEQRPIDYVGACLEQIRTAFFWNKPAIICSHRMNYIGGITPENREKNLVVFKNLLHRILQNWPDVEFMTSVELLELVKENQNAAS